jgi:hypothetical protein
MGVATVLHAYADEQAHAVLSARAALDARLQLRLVPVEGAVLFDYDHGLATPQMVRGVAEQAPLRVAAERVLSFGMVEGAALVEAEGAVYDPQDAVAPRSFGANGSQANRLAVVLNEREARLLTRIGDGGVETLADVLLEQESAQVVVIKQGPFGAYVKSAAGSACVPAYVSERVWKIGSGDCFAAHFALRWLVERRDPIEAARLASIATALYAQTQGCPDATELARFAPPEVSFSERVRAAHRPKVYLAGPFFTLAQLWLVEQTRRHLQAMGVEVFSPYHDVGHGCAQDVVEPDLSALRAAQAVFAIADGLDAGTVYEIGYACARGVPAVVYCENETEENLKMIRGSGCVVIRDYVSALYRAAWTAYGA